MESSPQSSQSQPTTTTRGFVRSAVRYTLGASSPGDLGLLHLLRMMHVSRVNLELTTSQGDLRTSIMYLRSIQISQQ